jgi:predicted RNA-binding protein YlxR (DUF448 family)
VTVDERGEAPGRGAYVCRDAECVDKALQVGQLAHAFKRPSEPPTKGAPGILATSGARPALKQESLKDHEALNHKVRR